MGMIGGAFGNRARRWAGLGSVRSFAKCVGIRTLGWLASGGKCLIRKSLSLQDVASKNTFIVHLAAYDKSVLSDFLRTKLLVEGHSAVVAAVAADDPLGCLLLDRREEEQLHHLVGQSRTVQAAVDVELFQFERFAGGDLRQVGGHGFHMRCQMPEGLMGQLHFRCPALGTSIEIRGDGLRGIALVEEHLEVFGIIEVAPGLKPQKSPQLGKARKIRQSSSSDPKAGIAELTLALDGSRVDGMGS